MIDYHQAFQQQVDQIIAEGRYREMIDVRRHANRFPMAAWGAQKKEVVMWCINDYLGMSQHPDVIQAAIENIMDHGLGSGGTRNIGGNSYAIVELEQQIAELHQREAALTFTSGFVANDATLTTLAKIFPDLIYFSDEANHASMISGIRNSRATKHIYRHLDVEHLESLLASVDINAPKVIAFESAYSMDGLISPIKEICALAKKYNAMTYLDEVHSVGLYGPKGAGIAHMLGEQNNIDIMQGTLAKAYGVIGGYISGTKKMIEAIRLTASGFIFTTSLPPALAAAASASIKYLRNSDAERQKHQMVVKQVKEELTEMGIKFLDNASHIIPIIIGDPELTRQASRILVEKYNIFVQHINFPTVARGTERLRITPTPYHTTEMIKHLAWSLKQTFVELQIITKKIA